MNSSNLSATLGPDLVSRKSFSGYLVVVTRILLGLPMVIFGLNAFLNFIPPPETPLPAAAVDFATALVKSGYMMPLIGLTQLAAGILLTLNRWVPLALALLAPFLVNALLFHVFLERSGLPPTLVFLALEIYLVWVYRAAFRSLLQARAATA